MTVLLGSVMWKECLRVESENPGKSASVKGIITAPFSAVTWVASSHQKSLSSVPLMQNEINITPLTLWDAK